MARAAGAVIVAVSTAAILLALAVLPFLNPLWVGFAQERAEAAAWTGYTPAELRHATDGILSDLILGPPDFDVEVSGQPVLTPREREHMTDVRGVFAGFALAAVVAVITLLIAGRATRASLAFWGAVRAGAAAMAAGVVVVGVVGLVAFEVAFELFHRLFFASGTYTFDPTTERLVQLFPQRFWFETALAVGAVALFLATGTALLARRRLRADAPTPAARTAGLEPA